MAGYAIDMYERIVAPFQYRSAFYKKRNMWNTRKRKLHYYHYAVSVHYMRYDIYNYISH